MKIAIVVQGRFQAFDMARELSKRGHEVTLFTSYPEFVVKRFDVGDSRVRSFALQGIAAKGLGWMNSRAAYGLAEPRLHAVFGRWAAKQIGHGQWDVIYCWSGISEELLRAHGITRGATLLMRGSAHIRTQASILEDEERRTGTPLDRPSPWMIQREEREYQLAHKIVVLSRFAYESFLRHNVPEDKLLLLPLGVNCEAFRPTAEVIQRRCERIRAGARLRVLYVGTMSFRKGMWDAGQLVRDVGDRFEFHFVGPALSEVRDLMAAVSLRAHVMPKQPQHELPRAYAEGDLFFFPTLEDGFAVVLSQAQASALPILVTANCGGPDIIREGETGWVLPIRSPESFSQRLFWCDTHRNELAEMVERNYANYRTRDWTEVATDFERMSLAQTTVPSSSSRIESRAG
jgi:glycosyltransferase involved in cell wall biosynthesis